MAFTNESIPATPSGYKNGKYQYNIDLPEIGPAVIFWSNSNSRWELWDESLATFHAYLTNPGDYPISNNQYVWVNSGNGVCVNTTNPVCLSTVCLTLNNPSNVNNSNLLDKSWKQSTLVPKGTYNGKPWFITKANINNTDYTFYVMWNNSRWEAWSSFTPSSIPSGIQYAYILGSGKNEYPTGDNWVTLTSIQGYNFSLSYENCSPLVCFLFIGDNVQSGYEYQSSTCSGIYNGRCYYEMNAPDGSSNFVYVLWNNTTNRWELWEDFNPLTGPIGSNSSLYGYLPVNSASPISSPSFPWVIRNSNISILNSSLGECAIIPYEVTVESACSPYEWTENGEIYTESGIYTYSSGGTIYALSLTITGVTTEVPTTVSIIDSYTWPISEGGTGTTYTTSGTYTNIVGCTTYTLNLTILPTPIPCGEAQDSGGQGIREVSFPLNPYGGIVVIGFNAYNVTDKLEIIHNDVKKATSGMTVPNEGPFDEVYNDTVPPSSAAVATIDQFIGNNKGSIPNRLDTYNTSAGLAWGTISSSDLNYTSNSGPETAQQLIWWSYTAADYNTNNEAIIKVIGAGSTVWDFIRICP